MLLCMGLFSTFLAWGRARHPQTRKAPPFGRAFLALAQLRFELAILLRGILARTIRVLLLLARLLAAALLLAGLLARVLVLLARVLVRVAHSESPLLNATARQRSNPAFGFAGTAGSAAIIAWR
jgi:hypothetical protein